MIGGHGKRKAKSEGQEMVVGKRSHRMEEIGEYDKVNGQGVGGQRVVGVELDGNVTKRRWVENVERERDDLS